MWSLILSALKFKNWLPLKIIGVVLVVAFLVAQAGLLVKVHDDGIKNRAALQWENAQMTRVIEENKQAREQLSRIEQNGIDIAARVDAQKVERDKRVKGARDYLATPQVKGADKPAPDVVKETIRRLKDKHK